MQTLSDWIILWWMVIAFYQFVDFLATELISEENILLALKRVGIGLLLLPTFPIMDVFSKLVVRLIHLDADETEFKKD